ncbi:tRNA modification GTPase [Botrimarina hoheduenensis]|uniref:tRNA modification GTPase MnmE n=1 Tax=Botrimarina hoheduenensis TaxID=2528000 RepID=A0A5C5WCM6_9BACT|nr:GTPase [Botrimarina hoheduenensis]TWT48430.1 tRNA modification GTPase MnmE [Botrimarina hoheduenensis]
MSYVADENDTIVAAATPNGPAERAIVRLAGPQAVQLVAGLADRSLTTPVARRFGTVAIRVPIGGAARAIPCDVFIWPDARSYTRQPAAELHTVGSPPVVEALIAACLAAGARLAQPGEFTLRACLAGRLDLLQAEAVLAVIDARHTTMLSVALEQMAGGLSRPLAALRGSLLDLLADLEAGLDFVDEEDVRFVEADDLARRLTESAELIERIAAQTQQRGATAATPRVALVGRPNVGKSRLFNALVERYGVGERCRPALVADQPGVTRDEIVAVLSCAGMRFSLIDTPGDDEDTGDDKGTGDDEGTGDNKGSNRAKQPIDVVDEQARQQSRAKRGSLDLEVFCTPAATRTVIPGGAAEALTVLTMVDRGGAQAAQEGTINTSAVTGAGLAELAAAIAQRLADRTIETASASVVSTTAGRCAESLSAAREALKTAAEAARCGYGDELVAFDLRRALDAIGLVTGEIVTDEVLDQIFSKFCIGK